MMKLSTCRTGLRLALLLSLVAVAIPGVAFAKVTVLSGGVVGGPPVAALPGTTTNGVTLPGGVTTPVTLPPGAVPVPFYITSQTGPYISAYTYITASPASVAAANAKCGGTPYAERISVTEMMVVWSGDSNPPGPNNPTPPGSSGGECWQTIIPCSMGIADGLAYDNPGWSSYPGGVCTYL
jgi:hypothetical protein